MSISSIILFIVIGSDFGVQVLNFKWISGSLGSNAVIEGKDLGI